MLQPAQLEDVSIHYADEIREMREFFLSAGVSVEMKQALAQVSQRLGEDRAFHRDLTSQVWVMLHRRGQAVRYGETLAIVALAAAGKKLAADADEAAAHNLLRFVMEAHDGLNPPVDRAKSMPQMKAPVTAQVNAAQDSIAKEAVVPAAEVVKTPFPAKSPAPPVKLVPEAEKLQPAKAAEMPVRSALDTPIRSSRLDFETIDGERRSKPLMWGTLAAVLVLVALAGWWFYRGTSVAPEGASAPAPVVDGNAAPVPAAPVVELPASEQPLPSVAPTKPSVVPQTRHATSATIPAHRQSVPAQQTYVAPSAAHPAASTPQQVASAAASSAAAPRASVIASAATTSSPAPIVRSSPNASKPAAPTTVSSGTISKQLDRPGLTPEQEAEYDNTGRRYPRLLRRTPSSNSNDVLMAKATVPPPPGAPNATAGSTSAGTVRPTSLGVMSSNLIYSPAAAYPSAASAAHVAGAVKLEAVVDKSGNVAAARVISGPVQLRDAALNAVQQWRYKPYVLGGKARQFTTQALMEFELP